tara:strand:+ start:88 stop:924 length:837 start_codon:yes stop_codon:yes gene_type:complete
MYYPKSQIIENLYSSQNELFDAQTGEEYIGPYYKTSRNEYFTGKNPQDKPNRSLVTNSVPTKSTDSEPLPESYYIIDDAYYYAKQIKTDALAPRPPISSVPFPTENDYKVGEFIRYFLKKSNSNTYMEVDKKEYDLFAGKNNKVQYKFYTPIKIDWQLTGKLKDVYQTNLRLAGLIERRLIIFGFITYFKDKFTQYFRHTPSSNLFTDGTEFKNKRTGEIYIGSYHIHPDKGPMVGATHVSSPHDFLIPISGSFEQIETEVAQQPIVRRTSGGSGGGY